MSASNRPLTHELLRQLGIVAAVPLIVTIAFFIWQLYPQLKANVANEQQMFAELIAERSQEYLQTAEEQVAFFLPFLSQLDRDDLLPHLDHFVQTIVGDLDHVGRESVDLEVLGPQVPLGDLHLLVVGVPTDADDLHAVKQWLRHV